MVVIEVNTRSWVLGSSWVQCMDWEGHSPLCVHQFQKRTSGWTEKTRVADLLFTGPGYFKKLHLLSWLHACVLSPFSCVRLFVTPWTTAHQVHLSMGILQARTLESVAIPPPGYFSDPGIEPASLMSPALARGFFTTSATQEAQYLGWQVHILNYWFTQRSMPSSKLRGDLSKASHEQRGKQSQQRWRSGYDRKQASIQSCWHLPRGSRDASTFLPLYTWDTLWPSRTLPWPDLVVLWPDSVSPPGKLRVLTVTSSRESQDFLLQLRTQQLRAASLTASSTASSARPEAATQVLTQSYPAGTSCHSSLSSSSMKSSHFQPND